MKKAQIKTPLGITLIEGDTNGISKISVEEDAEVFSAEIPSALKEANLQLSEYFEGKRKEFTFKLNPKGTDFQQRVWSLKYGRYHFAPVNECIYRCFCVLPSLQSHLASYLAGSK